LTWGKSKAEGAVIVRGRNYPDSNLNDPVKTFMTQLLAKREYPTWEKGEGKGREVPLFQGKNLKRPAGE